VCCFVVWGVFIACPAAAAGSSNSDFKNIRAIHKLSSDWLYVVQVEHGVLKHVGGKKYRLTFDFPSAEHIVMAFTDRPVRKSMSLTFDELIKLVALEDSYTFSNHLPNASVIFSSNPSHTRGYSIRSFHVRDGHASFELALLPEKLTKGELEKCGKVCEHSGRLAVFFDSGFSS